MLQDVIHPPQSEQLQIEGLASPIEDPILAFCDEAELFGAAAEASSCSGCCYEDINSCYTTNTATTTAATITTADLSYPCSSSVFASDTTKFDPASLSVLLDTQPDPDISASLNYRFFVDPQEPFDLSSTLQPSQLPIMSTTNFSTTNTFSPDPTAAIPTQSLQSVYEQQECLAQLQPYIGLDPTSTSPTSCSFFDPGGIAGPSYLTAGCLGEVNGMYGGGGILGGGAEMVEFQADNGGGIYGMDSMQSVFNTSDLQEVLSENQHHLANGSGGCSSPTPLTATSNMTSLDESTFKVGRLSVEEKKERINRFMKKRNERNFRKKIKYACRKTLADSRPRVRGRFAKNDEFGEATRPRSSHHEDEDDDEVVIKEEEDMIDSDIFAHITGVNSFKCNYTLQSWI
ncbi:Zinc finger protein CONSTANS-LIKE 5 [Acorus calamus]|uniref:Zinc finger protein CONSTANS-LIKE 5 n=1 Tax=Acorus calamus TaxID=4465 RepID=A0AAV9EPQ3_ACOCL|nr:Zinc finger protein CONSTANS-LIKE 5 [Acorus calamus]